jgi:hypothetical protein
MKKRDLNNIFNSESPESHWEIFNHNIQLVDETPTEEVTLLYVPEDDYSANDVKIKMPHEHFIELVRYLKTFKS